MKNPLNIFNLVGRDICIEKDDALNAIIKYYDFMFEKISKDTQNVIDKDLKYLIKSYENMQLGICKEWLYYNKIIEDIGKNQALWDYYLY